MISDSTGKSWWTLWPSLVWLSWVSTIPTSPKTRSTLTTGIEEKNSSTYTLLLFFSTTDITISKTLSFSPKSAEWMKYIPSLQGVQRPLVQPPHPGQHLLPRRHREGSHVRVPGGGSGGCIWRGPGFRRFGTSAVTGGNALCYRRRRDIKKIMT